MEGPRYFYVRDKGAAAHHWDYLKNRNDHALCGHAFEAPVDLGYVARPKAVCRACQALLPRADGVLWREIAERLDTELAETRRRLEQVEVHAENQRRALRQFNEAKKRSPRRQPPPERKSRMSPRMTKSVKPNRARKPPPIKIVSGGAPGLGKRR
ncbi:hypothetical protein [Mycobacterium sp. IS-1742]|uniref:hypothetical protein n=1 Tax=Mycobacterium sp. IS-1742 TaxID=1772285 RepID=UPI000AF76C02|nr:hypothetical protein [Mycobacterium sp. IS-1742]